jgi:hypothetical protein
VAYSNVVLVYTRIKCRIFPIFRVCVIYMCVYIYIYIYIYIQAMTFRVGFFGACVLDCYTVPTVISTVVPYILILSKFFFFFTN